MRCLLALVGCATLAGMAQACWLPNTIQGQDTFQAVNMAYIECKKTAVVDQTALCACSTNQLTQAKGCRYDWILPWVATVKRDKYKFCGLGSSGSLSSSLSGSDQSIPSSGTSSESSFTDSSAQLTPAQKLFWVALVVCLCLCCCGAAGGAYAMKGKKKSPKRDRYEPSSEDGDFEQQQYDQGYRGDAPYEEPEMQMPDQQFEAAPMMSAPVIETVQAEPAVEYAQPTAVSAFSQPAMFSTFAQPAQYSSYAQPAQYSAYAQAAPVTTYSQAAPAQYVQTAAPIMTQPMMRY